jgi:hypothetical protein
VSPEFYIFPQPEQLPLPIYSLVLSPNDLLSGDFERNSRIFKSCYDSLLDSRPESPEISISQKSPEDLSSKVPFSTIFPISQCSCLELFSFGRIVSSTL